MAALDEKAELQRIIDEQRSIIEEQRRILDQHRGQPSSRHRKTIRSGCSSSLASDISSTAGSIRSFPATSSSAGSGIISTPLSNCAISAEAESPTATVAVSDRPSSWDLVVSQMEADASHGRSNCRHTLEQHHMANAEPRGLLEDISDMTTAPAETARKATVAWTQSLPATFGPLGDAADPRLRLANATKLLSSALSGYGQKDPHADTLASTNQIQANRSSSHQVGTNLGGAFSGSTMQADGTFLNRELLKIDLGCWVLDANVSPKGRCLCTASDDRTARVYDLVSKSLIQSFAHDGWVWSAQFSPDGEFICSSAEDGTARIFNLESGNQVHSLQHAGAVKTASYHSTGELLLTASQDSSARLFDTDSGMLVKTVEHPGWVLHADWSPEGARFCTASDDHLSRIFDAETGQPLILLDHGDWVRCSSFSPDGKNLCTAADDKVVRLYDLQSKAEVQRFPHCAEVSSAQVSPDGYWLCTSCKDSNAYIFDLRKGIELVRFEHEGRVCSASFSADGRRLCTASEDGHVRIFGHALQSMLSLIRMTRPTTPPKAQSTA